jgi:hypothetical protein
MVFENGVLRKLFRPKWDEVTGEWKKEHKEELNNLNTLTNTVCVVKSRCTKLARYLASMGEDTVVHRVLLGSLRVIYHSGDDDTDESIILKWTRSKLEGSWGLERFGSG